MPHVSQLNLTNPKGSKKWGRWPARSNPVDADVETEEEVVVMASVPDSQKEPGTPPTVPVDAPDSGAQEGAAATGLPVVTDGKFVEPARVVGF